MADTGSELLSKVFKKQNNIVSRNIAGETILVPISGKLADMQRIFSLNSAAEFIWNGLDGIKNLEAIRADLISSFDVNEEDAGHDIEEFIAALLREDLITEAY